LISARPAHQEIIVPVPDEKVIPIASVEKVVACGGETKKILAVQSIGAVPTIEGVIGNAALKQISTIASVKNVVAADRLPGDDREPIHIDRQIAVQTIIIGSTSQDVVARAADQHIVAFTAV
jgi:hypothetical protein